MGEFVDITGTKWGKWTVLAHDTSKPKGMAFWICRCDCGYEKSIRGTFLRQGKYLSCPSCTVKPPQRMDLAGQRFGRLTVIRFDCVDKHRKTKWICRCDCGNERSVTVQQLLSGHTKSCGCYRYDMTMAANEKRKSQRALNEYHVEDGVVYVALRNGKTMLCDEDDWERLKDFTWREDDNGYARRNRNKGMKMKDVMFHNLVMGESNGLYVDHINQNKLDNRKCNLRFCTPQVNILNRSILSNNTSGVTGVCRYKDKWHAQIGYDNQKINLGYFKNKEDAIKARKEAEERLHKPLLEIK